MKKVVLFSPTGYVGGFLNEQLSKESDITLITLDRNSRYEEYMEDYDIMLYSAAVSHADAVKYVEDNVIAAIHMVDFCKRHHIRRIIYLSSDSIYGDLNVKEVTEDAFMLNPGIYGTTKYLAEKIIIESEIPYYIVRMPGIVGRVWRNTYLCRLMDCLSGNECVKVYNANKLFNNVLDIDDLIRFLIVLCRCEQGRSEIFLLGNTEKITLFDMVTYMKHICYSKSKIRNVSAGNNRYFTLNIDKAVQYGYCSKGIKQIIDELYVIKPSKIGYS